LRIAAARIGAERLRKVPDAQLPVELARYSKRSLQVRNRLLVANDHVRCVDGLRAAALIRFYHSTLHRILASCALCAPKFPESQAFPPVHLGRAIASHSGQLAITIGPVIPDDSQKQRRQDFRR
jgi:hypothetical protein